MHVWLGDSEPASSAVAQPWLPRLLRTFAHAGPHQHGSRGHGRDRRGQMGTSMIPSQTVLVVDDDESIREVVEMALRSEGYEVVGAPNGAVALDLIGQARPGLILLDMRMPVMDGWQFARVFRQTPGPHVPIIAFTAARDARERAKQISADDVLAKPFELDDLFAIVRRHLERHGTGLLAETDAGGLIARAERAEEFHRALFTNVPDIILVSGAEGRVLEANVAATEMLGYTRGELLGMPVSDLIAGTGDHGETQTLLYGGPWRGELDLRRKNGASLPVEARSVPIGLKDDTVHVSVIRDITDRRRAESAAAAAAAAAEADRLKTELLNTVSHELRTPLAAIKGFSTLLLEFSDRIEWNDVEVAIREIDGASDRLIELVDNLLDLARLESGSLNSSRSELDIHEVMTAAVADARRRHPQRAFTLETAPVLPLVMGDPYRLREVAANLLENAVKFSPSGGDIEVRLAAAPGVVTFSVTDHGVGIPEQHLERVFERFYRVRTERTQDVGGTGLGLAICCGILEQHSGTLAVASIEGAGSTFTVTLPVV
jgi:two-component system phosphate regulon sensor histidine kinase PhoR